MQGRPDVRSLRTSGDYSYSEISENRNMNSETSLQQENAQLTFWKALHAGALVHVELLQAGQHTEAFGEQK